MAKYSMLNTALLHSVYLYIMLDYDIANKKPISWAQDFLSA